MYRAHCLEQQIRLMLSTMFNEAFLKVPPEERDVLLNKYNRATLGQMKTELDNTSRLSSTLERKLKKAVDVRNWLAHHYFHDRVKEISTPNGRENMILELQEEADKFGELDMEFTEVFKKWANKLGISQEDIDEEMIRLIS